MLFALQESLAVASVPPQVSISSSLALQNLDAATITHFIEFCIRLTIIFDPESSVDLVNGRFSVGIHCMLFIERLRHEGIFT